MFQYGCQRFENVANREDRILSVPQMTPSMRILLVLEACLLFVALLFVILATAIGAFLSGISYHL